MKNWFFIKNKLILFSIAMFLSTGNSFAQIRQQIQLNYGGIELKGSIEIAVKIVEKSRNSQIKEITYSDKKVKADVSKYKSPGLVVAFSNLHFDAPENLSKKLSLYITPPSLPKGFKQNVALSSGPLQKGEKRVYNLDIVPTDTILADELKFVFSYISIGNRNFKFKNNTFQLDLNITPPPLFPPNANDDELWKIATKLNTKKSYEVYLKRFPNGKSIRKARSKRQYLIDHPPLVLVPNEIKTNNQIFLKDENTEWRKAINTNKIDAYQSYLKDFPKGQFASVAKSNMITLSKNLDEQVLQSTEEELIGRMIFHLADTMTVGQDYKVRLEISSDTSAHFIEKLIASVEKYSDQPEDFSTEIIQIGKTMQAHLEEIAPEGEKNFYIKLFGESAEREVELYSAASTIWEWVVRPLKKGYHPLYFTIEIITKKDGVEKPKVLPVYDSKITILSQSFFQTYKIQIISGGIIALLIAVILILVFRKKKVKEKQDDLEAIVKSNPLEGATKLVENDKIKRALEVLDQFLKNRDAEILQEIILLKSRLANVDNNFNKATISKEAASNERNNIKLAVLDIIERSKTFS